MPVSILRTKYSLALKTPQGVFFCKKKLQQKEDVYEQHIDVRDCREAKVESPVGNLVFTARICDVWGNRARADFNWSIHQCRFI
jgi:hypothetical protein